MNQKKQIKPFIDDEYYDLVPRPTKEQRKALKKSIENEGQKEPITIDPTGKILDGNTRYEICEELGRETKYLIRNSIDEEANKNYAITVNLKRRHLNDFQIYELFEKQIEMIKKTNLTERNKNIWKVTKGKRAKNTYEKKVENSTIFKANELTGLGTGTVQHCMFVKKHGDKKLIQKVRDGKISLNRAHVSLSKITITGNKLRGVVYRSRMGIVCDILRTIKESTNDVRISNISQKANISYETAKSIIEELTTGDVLGLKKTKIRGKYYETKSTQKSYLTTHKGNELYSKFLEIYQLLPESMRNK